jgi:hypothetical protein
MLLEFADVDLLKSTTNLLRKYVLREEVCRAWAWALRLGSGLGILFNNTQSPSLTYLVNFSNPEKARAQSMKPKPDSSPKKSGPTHLKLQAANIWRPT